ncbi:MAG: ferrous iron transport protein B [Epsilonproteobacteria bacterium]|nr:ferrous iron transport protein B [Campylobacterota bacterium]OIO14115.1 MAG: ferrous iron transport protein B [Helicobacteraceae bacterium CG1_02_36_14]PIP09702.1 MAG: ferrous iron transport protein B [Sulfurimonas sp. CG23_combo_of_CG06-09_8_20_14_all_36_33]PIS26247.1 MAG: ferrous iron transport protein B [Sulfurimonas sp. CG08_land_8_20_14_0_20_36_33]PIU34331.1 MAG: ferrous iron transport protein B [Sulfurimonas sp. CG07_land_8_20_14_0_80_36_56]PIV02629.1 MAG: ferrous iron transport prote
MSDALKKSCPITAKHIKVALVGQPNVGKSMLINSISNAHLHVGNFTGVTVEKTEVLFDYKEYHFTVVDLPGTYAFTDYTIEERVTHDYLCQRDYDLILNVVDSTNLEKNLQLSSELMSMSKNMVIALNMSDEAKKEGIEINSEYMSQLLAIPCIKVSAVTKDGVNKLIDTLIEQFEAKIQKPKLIFSEPVEEEIRQVVKQLVKYKYETTSRYRNVAINLLKNNKQTYAKVHADPIWTELQPILIESVGHVELHHDSDDIKEAFAQEYASFNRGIVAEVLQQESTDEKKTLTEKIDEYLIHTVFGIPIFLFFMWSLFQITFEIGSIPMEWIDGFFTWLGDTIGATIANEDIRSLVVDGVISGVGAVVLFVPNIIILFIGIALLESTGYMSRVAFLLDGFFHKFGLHGQSFIPLVTGFGCSIPAYMSARILKNDRDRLLTLFIIGFMSCGARLPVYVLFAGAFFSADMAGNVLFIIYISGALFGLLAAKVLKVTAFKGVDEPFVMEMPKYRLPSFKLIWHTVLTKTWLYLKKAGTYIAAASLLVWFLSNYPHNMELSKEYATKIENAQTKSEKSALANALAIEHLEQSYLGQAGKFTEPLFTPLGFDWKMSIALQTGLAAKEVVVSTLGVLYSLGDDVDEKNRSLISAISKNISFPSAIAFITVIMVYLPCLAASIVFTREAGGVKYFFYLLAFTSIVAYSLAFIAFNITKMMI